MRRVEMRAGALWGVLACVTVALLLKQSQAAIASVERGLVLCGHTMIPALFPFMVVAEVLVRSGVGRRMATVISAPLRRLFLVSEEGACALLMGGLCGFPVGARTAAAYYRTGQMSAGELGRVLCFGNVPSAAFLVSAVGISLFDSATLGRWLLGACLVSAWAVGLFLRREAKRDGMTYARRTEARSESLQDETHGAALLTGSVSAAAMGMLNVCAAVLLFSALIGTLSVYADALALPPVLRTLLLGSMELSTGVCEAAAVSDTTWAAILCGVLAGWGGLSVHSQIVAVCGDAPFRMGRFWLSRAVQGALTGLLMLVALRLGLCPTPSAIVPPSASATVDAWGRGLYGGAAMRIWCLAWCVAFGVTLLIVLGRALYRALRKEGVA